MAGTPSFENILLRLWGFSIMCKMNCAWQQSTKLQQQNTLAVDDGQAEVALVLVLNTPKAMRLSTKIKVEDYLRVVGISQIADLVRG